ncbi:MAG: TerC family protein, partial [Ktedonobacteraceae bacterium]
PAVFAVTQDPFIVFTSNVFAILGLRSLYFVFANVIDKFHYLRLGLAVILTYVGVKMMLADIYPIPTFLSLTIIALVLTIAIIASVARDRQMSAKLAEPQEQLSSSPAERDPTQQ